MNILSYLNRVSITHIWHFFEEMPEKHEMELSSQQRQG